jgi:hypothetical protein
MDQLPARGYEDPNGGVSWAPVVEFAAGAEKARAEFQRQALAAVHAAAAAEKFELYQRRLSNE